VEINHRFDTQETQLNEMMDQFHRWNANLSSSFDDILPEDVAAGSLDPINEG